MAKKKNKILITKIEKEPAKADQDLEEEKPMVSTKEIGEGSNKRTIVTTNLPMSKNPQRKDMITLQDLDEKNRLKKKARERLTK